MTWFAPFMENFGHLGRGDRSGIQGSYHDVVRTLIVDVRLVVSEDSIIEVLEPVAQLPHGPSCQMTQITFSKAGVFS